MGIGSRLRGAMAASVLLGIICVAFTAHAADKTLVWGKPAEITGFDVHVAGTVASWEMYQMVYETLLNTDENLKVEPALAESWEQTLPTTYVFKLRSGAKFSNGRPVTAADVAGSLQRIKNPETASYWSAQLGTIARIETPDDQTVKVELETPHPAFLPALAHISAAILPIQELKAGQFNPAKDMFGSGPFMVKEHKHDESWSLARNPYYWGKRLPVADELEALIIPDDSARVAALRDGRIDFTTFENPDIANMLSSAANIAVLPLKTTNYFRIDVNALSPKSAFNDQRVR
jgi:peptide/nickel transport system substrate-binding protein